MAWGGYFFFHELDSTSSAALRWEARRTDCSLCVSAEVQTAGRGKAGRTWFSEPGSLNFSFLFFPERTTDLQILTLACAQEVSKAIIDLTGLETNVKWPNDVMAGELKIAGILLETRWQGTRAALVIGIGINCNQGSFPCEIAKTARSLSQCAGGPVDPKLLFCILAKRIDRLLDTYETGELSLDETIENCATLGRQVAISTHQGVVEGAAVSIDDLGSLQVRVADGTIKVVQEGDLQYKI